MAAPEWKVARIERCALMMSERANSRIADRMTRFLALIWVAAMLAFAPQSALAQEGLTQSDLVAPPPAIVPPAAMEQVPDDAAADATSGDPVIEDAGGYVPMGPEMIKGQPTNGSITFQDQYSPNGDYALWMHDAILLPMVFGISLLVLGLLLFVIAKFNRRANKVPSRTTHNTLVEVLWTIIPVIILLAIAVPSITLLAKQFKTPPADALTIKATGYQWYWGYTYPDNGGFEIISNMMPEEEARAKGFPGQLEVDNRLVLPVGEPIRIQTTAADVIHSFAVPSLWFKHDAVPGRINEKTMIIKEPGIYYGQCSELCGARHGYMPIAIEALPRPQFEAWVRAQGGTVGNEAADTDGVLGAELPGLQQPESAVPDAAGAGAPPTRTTAPGTPVTE
nr:cytochrome c oxidase subunit II [Alteripontixanthobacter maritimus]